MNAPASPFEEFAATVAAALPRLSPQQREIAQYVMEHPDDFALATAAAAAEAAGVQLSALVRFANALDFAGFSDLQQIFKNRLLERAGSYRDRIGALRRSGADPGKPALPAGVLQQFIDEGAADLHQLGHSVAPADLKRATELICAAPRVHVLAQRRAFPVAAYLAYALSQLDLKVHLLDGIGGMLGESLRQLERGDVLVVASFKNYSPQVIEAAALARDSGLSVVAITDHALSPLLASASVGFRLGAGSNTSFRSLVSPLCLAQALVVSAGHHLVASPRGGRRGASGKQRRSVP